MECITMENDKPFIKDSLSIGKTMMSLVEPKYVKTTADVLTFGAEKYGRDNWKKCQDKSLYEDALLRHIFAYLDGEKCDQESGISHLAHASCNLMFLQWMEENEPKQ